jgi:Mg-chelatase subunit ChlD
MTHALRALKASARSPAAALALLAAGMSLGSDPAQAAEAAAGKVLFILDASGSMWGEVKGEDKILIAKKVMSDLVRELPDGLEVGLEVYGHRSKGDCKDIEIMVPPASGNRDAMLEKIEAIAPKGMTPITGSLQMAADALRESEQQTTIVLVSDGKESCEADPCAAVEAIRAQGMNVRVHVVGFDVKEEERKQLQCIADAGGGKYFSADDSAQLTTALTEVRQVVTEAPKVEETPAKTETATKTVKLLPEMATVTTANGLGNVYLVDPESGEEVEGILADGQEESVPSGTYKVRYGTDFEVAEVEVKAGETVMLDANKWLATVKTMNGLGNVYLVDPQSGKEIEGILAKDSAGQVPAGTYRIRYGDFEVETVELQPGQTVTLDAAKWLATVKTLNGRGNVYLDDAESGKEVEGILANDSSGQIPAGTYRVRYGDFEVDTIELTPGQTATLDAHKWLGTVKAPKLTGNNLYLVDPSTNKDVATLVPALDMVQVPAGTYKLKLGDAEMGSIDVVAGQELVIE